MNNIGITELIEREAKRLGLHDLSPDRWQSVSALNLGRDEMRDLFDTLLAGLESQVNHSYHGIPIIFTKAKSRLEFVLTEGEFMKAEFQKYCKHSRGPKNQQWAHPGSSHDIWVDVVEVAFPGKPLFFYGFEYEQRMMTGAENLGVLRGLQLKADKECERYIEQCSALLGRMYE